MFAQISGLLASLSVCADSRGRNIGAWDAGGNGSETFESGPILRDRSAGGLSFLCGRSGRSEGMEKGPLYLRA